MDSQSDMVKILVAHPGRQHSYRLVKALNSAGMLYKYATTVYDKEGSILMRIVKLFLKGDNLSRAQRRKCPGLHDNEVIQFCELGGLLLLALIRIDHKRVLTKLLSRHVSKLFQRKLAQYIIREKINVVISYDCNSKYLFNILDNRAPEVIKIIDNAHPNRHYLYYDYHRHWEKVGEFSKTMEACGYITNESVAKEFGEELKMADYHIVASSYSQEALEFEGIPKEKIFVVPYGVDEQKFVESNRSYTSRTLKVLFIGDVNQRKGIKSLLEAAKEIHQEGFIFNIIGVGNDAFPELFSPYSQYVNFCGYVTYTELLRYLRESHVFVFPTMGEGFGLVLLEAMAAGLPVITTPNCGGRDVVKDGWNGFLVPVCDSSAIMMKLQWFMSHPASSLQMSRNATECAREYSWGRYEKNLIQAIKTVASL